MHEVINKGHKPQQEALIQTTKCKLATSAINYLISKK